MLKDRAEILAEPILQIVNMLLNSKFPEGYQVAEVRTTFKKGEI